jgi:AraC-like DNA-binding protein
LSDSDKDKMRFRAPSDVLIEPQNFNESHYSIESKDFIEYLEQQKSCGNEIISAEQMLGTEVSPWFNGRVLSWIPEAGYAASLRDVNSNSDFVLSSNIASCLSIEWVLEGDFDVNLGAYADSNRGLSRVYFSSHLENGKQTRFYKKGAGIRSLGLWVPAEILINQFAIDIEKLSPTLQAIIRLERESTAIISLSTHMRKALEDIVNHKYEGKLSSRYMSAKVIELLCYLTESILSPEETFEADNDLPRHKSQAMSTVLQCLNNNIASPPSIQELAKLVGLSRSVMTNTFKNSYGVSITEYLLQKRMDAAYELLKSGKLSILEVALAVGYEDQSAFGRVYKKHHKHSPSGDKPKA